MKIAITGGSGFIGNELKNYWANKGYDLVFITRKDYVLTENLNDKISNVDGIIHLAGAPIVKRWTKRYKKILYSSRIDTIRIILKAINKTNKRPKWIISASAIGIYPNNIIIDESTDKYNNDFLGKLVKKWEDAVFEAINYNINVGIIRFGIVMSNNGGAFPTMIKPFKYGFGGNIGNGNQYMSYIHIKDLLRIFDFIIDNSYFDVINATTPYPIKNKEMTRMLENIFKKRFYFHVPKLLLKIIYGEASIVLTDSKQILPKTLIEKGFVFKYPKLYDVLRNLLK